MAFDPLSTGLTVLTTSIADTVWKRSSGLTSFLYKFFKNKLLAKVIIATKKYAKEYIDRHGKVKVLFMNEPMLIDSIYIDVEFQNPNPHKRSVLTNLKQKDFLKSRISALQVANKTQYLTVLGNPGTGKSTFLRKIGLEAVKGPKLGSYKHHGVPVFLELKRIDIDPEILDFEKVISEEFKICGFPNPEEFTQAALNQGKLLILFDGLDEVPSKKFNKILSKIEDFVDQYNKNRFIVSCRVAAYTSRLRRFSDVVISEFSDEQTKSFINNWFSTQLDKDMHTAKQFLSLLKNRENLSVKKLAKTPLLLIFLCLVYDKTQSLPNNKSEIYEKVISIILEEWAADKRIEQEPIYQGMYTSLEKVFLSEIAYSCFCKERFSFRENSLVDYTRSFLRDKLDAPKDVNAYKVIKRIEIQQGILLEIADGLYSFSHATLQEYLTAWYIYHKNQFNFLVKNKMLDERWHPIFMLVSGLMLDRAVELFVKIQQECSKYIRTKNLYGFLAYSNQLNQSLNNKKYKFAANRALFLVNFIIQIEQAKFSDCLFLVNSIEEQYQSALALNKCIRETLLNLRFSGGVVGLSHAKNKSLELINELDLVFAQLSSLEKALNFFASLLKEFSHTKKILGEFIRILDRKKIEFYDLSIAIENNSIDVFSRLTHKSLNLIQEIILEINASRQLAKTFSEKRNFGDLGAAYNSLLVRSSNIHKGVDE